jgi:hypothetical protein
MTEQNLDAPACSMKRRMPALCFSDEDFARMALTTFGPCWHSQYKICSVESPRVFGIQSGTVPPSGRLPLSDPGKPTTRPRLRLFFENVFSSLQKASDLFDRNILQQNEIDP